MKIKTQVVCIRKVLKGTYIYVGRGSIYGNPFSSKPSKYPVIIAPSVEHSVAWYIDWLKTLRPAPGWIRPTFEQIMALKGQTLGCYCDGPPCHAYVLAAICDGKLNLREPAVQPRPAGC